MVPTIKIHTKDLKIRQLIISHINMIVELLPNLPKKTAIFNRTYNAKQKTARLKNQAVAFNCVIFYLQSFYILLRWRANLHKG